MFASDFVFTLVVFTALVAWRRREGRQAAADNR